MGVLSGNRTYVIFQHIGWKLEGQLRCSLERSSPELIFIEVLQISTEAQK